MQAGLGVVVRRAADASVAAMQDAARPTEDTDRFQVTAVLFAGYLFVHAVYLLAIGRVSPFTPLYLAAAIGCLLRPRAAMPFVLAAAGCLLDALWHMPAQSNHSLMGMVLCAAIVLAAASQAVRRRGLRLDGGELFRDVAPVGRWLLLGMYFYGVFHKINTDFLNPETSCAVVLWRTLPLPAPLLSWPLGEAAAIHGTFAVETFAAICLLTRRFRLPGLLAGVAFHWLIGFSRYEDYLAFSLLSILLHSLFLPAALLARLRASRLADAAAALTSNWRRVLVLLLALVLAAALLGREGSWLVAGLVGLALLLLFARDDASPGPLWDLGQLRTPGVLPTAFVALFLANGMLPYLGLKTGQTISMFSNLTTEGGENNHLLMRHLPQPFGLQDRLARIEATEDPMYRWPPRERYRYVEWSVIDRFLRSGLPVTYSVGEERVSLPGDRPHLLAAVEAMPAALRAFIVFKPVNMDRPRGCDSW
jgi:hypothetical protein